MSRRAPRGRLATTFQPPARRHRTQRSSRRLRAVYWGTSLAIIANGVPGTPLLVEALTALYLLAVVVRGRLSEAPAVPLLLLGIVATRGALEGFLVPNVAAGHVASLEGIASASTVMHIPGATVASFAVLSACILNALVRKRHAPVALLLLALVGLAAIAGALSSYQGLVAGYNGWSNPVRMVGTAAGFVWVATLTMDVHPQDLRRWLSRSVGPVSGLCVVALTLQLSLSHAMFLAGAVVSVAACFAFLSRRRLWFVLLLVGVFASAVAYTFTVAGAALAGAALALSRAGARGKGRARLVTVTILCLGFLFLLVAMFSAGEPAVDPLPSEYLQEAQVKFSEDRALLWAQTVDEIAARPVVGAPARQEYVLFGFPNRWLGPQIWVGGAHNVWLESARQFGVVGGIPLSILVIASLLLAATRLDQSPYSPVLFYGYALLATILVGCITGNYPLQPPVGLSLWIGLGVVCRAGQAGRNETS